MRSYTHENFIRDIKEDFVNARNNTAKKKKLRELMDKYGETREEIEANSTMQDWLEYQLANGDALLEQVRSERNKDKRCLVPSSDTQAQNLSYIYDYKINNLSEEEVEKIVDSENKEEKVDYSKYGQSFSKEFIDDMLKDESFHNAMTRYTHPNEGGLVNHKNDGGGLTNMGITQRYYPNEDIENLTRERADALLYRDYWLKTNIYKLPDELSGIVFDNAVLQGQPTTIKHLQKALGVKDDGILGPVTLRALDNANIENVKRKFIDNVQKREDEIVRKNPSQKVFHNGWRNRASRY